MAYSREDLQKALAGRYEIDREAGRGGMATVFRATDLKHHRPVAIKVLSPEIALAVGPERFLAEIDIAARLQHPHILPVHDSGRANGFLYYVMPFVEGQSLRDRLDRERQLPVEDAVRIAREVADALDYAHGQGVIHRDVKPENILWSGGHAIVADFGIARAVSEATGASLTRTGVVLGTPTYMSPEQASGAHQIDGRSDIYSLGCVLYEMLAGEPPFTGATVENVVLKHLTAEPKAVTSIRAAVPAPVARAIAKALAKTPADRFTTSAQFATALAGPVSEGARAGPARVLRFPRPSRRSLVELAVAAVALVAVAITLRGAGVPLPFGRERIESIAVLPLENLSRDPSQEYFADGMTEQLVTELASLQDVRVTSRTSVMRYKNTDKSIPEIGRELNVDAIVEGSVLRAEGRVRITAQLIRVANDKHLWAASYDRDLENLLTLHTDVARSIVGEIRARLATKEAPLLAPTSPVDPMAHEAYLKGRYHVRQKNEAAIWKGIAYFREALERDPRFGLAYAELADATILMGQEHLADPETAYQDAKEMAAKGLAVDDRLAEARASLAYASLLTWDWSKAEQEFKRAIELKPSYAPARAWYASYLLATGRADEAVVQAQRAWELDPLDLSIHLNVGICLYYGGRADDSARRFQEIVETHDDSTTRGIARFWLGLAYDRLGRYDAAIRELREVGGPTTLAPLANAYAASGREKEARNILDQVLAYTRSGQGYVPAFELATIYAGLGEKDRAFEWLEKACSTRRLAHLMFLRVEPVFAGLRPDPRFADLVRRAGLPTAGLAERPRRSAS